jgi:VWFA-related protein
MRYLCLALTFVTALSPQSQQLPTFRSAVTLVTVDVSVLDRDGKPVPGLAAGDFEVKLNGKVRPVKVLSFVQAAGELAPTAAAVVPKLAAAPEGVRQGRQTVTNEGVVAAAIKAGEDRVFVLLIDDLSFEPLRGKALFQAAKTFVDGLPAVDLVGIATTSGSAAVNPTADRSRIREVLAKAAGEGGSPQSLTPVGAPASETAEHDADGSVGVHQAIEIDDGNFEELKVAIARACFNGDRSTVDAQVLDVIIATNNCAGQVNRQARTIASRTRQTTRRQVSAYVSVIEAMRAATGLKHLVLLSDGLAVGRRADQLTPVARAAAAAGVQVSVLMEERDLSLTDAGRHQGAPAAQAQTDTGAPQRRIEDNKMFLAGGQLAAEMAGGQFYRIIGQPDTFFARVRNASAAVYRLGVEPPPDVDPSRITSVEAKVGRRGLTVLANRHGVAPPLSPFDTVEPTVDDKLKAAIGQGQSHGAVPLKVATALRRSSSSALDLSVNAEMPGTVKGPLIAMFGLVKEGATLGTITSGRREIAVPAAGEPFTLSVSLPAEPGSYSLRLAVADATGALGALEVPVEAELSSMGPFAASDLIIAWVDAKGQPHGMALEDLPPAATSLQALLELYAPAGGAPGMLDALKNDVQVELILTRAGETEPVDEREVVPQFSPGVLRTVVEYPIDDLTPGVYRLRANVRVGGQQAGAAIATVRKR